MRPEVMVRQVEALAEDLERCLPIFAERVERLGTSAGWASVRTVYLTGNGDSHHAARATRMAFEILAGLPCRPAPALPFLAYDLDCALPDPAGTLVVGISASGGTVRVAQGLEGARARGARTVAVTGSANSPVARAAEHALVVDLPGLEPSPGIRTYQASLLGLLLCAIGLAQARARPVDPDRLREELAGLAPILATTAASIKATCAEVGATLATAPVISVLGSGPSHGTALFGAAKIVEGAGVYAVGQDIDEWQHVDRLAYPLNTPVVLIAPPGRSHAVAVELLDRAQELGKTVIAVIDRQDQELATRAESVLAVHGRTREEFSPLLYHPFASYLAFAMAEKLGRWPFQSDPG